jgi:hypothetical protein
MKQPNREADEAVAHIRQNTGDPIRRFLDSVVSSRLEEGNSLQSRGIADPPRLNPLQIIKGAWARIMRLLFARDR